MSKDILPVGPLFRGRTTLEKVDEALSTLGGGQGVVVFFGMAKPVRTPLIGPPRQPR